MTTDNTQEHMHNSGEATSYAQRSAQAELISNLTIDKPNN